MNRTIEVSTRKNGDTWTGRLSVRNESPHGGTGEELLSLEATAGSDAGAKDALWEQLDELAAWLNEQSKRHHQSKLASERIKA